MQVKDIDVMLQEGIPFGTIEDRLERSALPTDIKNIFWLYAWCGQSRDGQRQVVAEMVAQALRA